MAAFRTALGNVIFTEAAEITYAEIIDALSTEYSLRGFYRWAADHPVTKLEHDKLCAGLLVEARKLRLEFDTYLPYGTVFDWHGM